MDKNEIEQTIKSLQNVLEIATKRAVENGDRLVKLGEPDINRGQFLSSVERVQKKAETLLKKLSEV